MRSLLCRALLCLFTLLASASTPFAQAQDEWKWPEKPKNLKVLPKDFTGEKLRPIMMGFTRSLGVRCNYCHVGEEGKPLSTYDFVSDKNPNKDRARAMYKMLGSISDQLKDFNSSGEQKVNVWCHTCHQGRPRPTTLEEEMAGQYMKSGVTAAIARYHELREKYYGKGGYDFSERALNGIAYELIKSKDYEGAIAIFRLNAEQYPESPNVWDSLAEGYLAAGNPLLAEIYYKKSLEMDPQNKNAMEQLQKLEKKSAP